MASNQTTRPDDASESDEGTDRRSTTSDSRNRPTESETRRSEDDPYEIRPYEPRFRSGYLELFNRIFEGGTDEWFRWKYEDNPYADHVPIVLATHDGDVVGAKPCFPLELRAGDRTVVGFQPADVVVHADHRRQGLYSRTTERMKERYADGNPSLFFNFPNEATLSGSLKHGWQIVESVPTYYRVQRPESVVDGDGDLVGSLASALRPAASGYLRARELLADGADDVAVRRHGSIPSATFVSLYRRAVPRTFHAHRDETFYDWRFESPWWSYEAYVARRDGDPIAGVVVGSRTIGGTRQTYLTDVVPLANAPGRADGLAAILERVLADHADADVVAASGRTLEPSLLRQYGFLSDQSEPLSRIGDPTTQVAYPIADDDGHEWTVGGRSIADPANWSITFAEQDTA